jgi:Flp pilus assembly protein TadG
MSRLHSRQRRGALAASRINRRGISIVLVGFLLVVLVGFVSLAVDIGRVRLARAQLQTAADAAARSGAWSLPVSSDDVKLEANAASLNNPCISTASGGAREDAGVLLDTDKDIHFGVWDNTKRTFTELFDNSGTTQDERRAANAVRVVATRYKSRNAPVKLLFAPVLGVFYSELDCTATAYITKGPDKDFGFVGLNGVSSNGNKAIINGGVATDGDFNLGNGDIVGYARPGITGKINQGPNSNITGWTANLDYKLAPLYPIIQSAPAGALTIPKGSKGKPATLIGGPDAAHPAIYTGTVPSSFTVSGYVRIYATADIDLKSINVTWTNPATIDPVTTPSRLEYYMTGNKVKTVGGNGNTACYCHVYAPQCDVTLGGGGNFYGWAIGKTLSFTGNSSFNYDNSKIFNTNPYILHLVQ